MGLPDDFETNPVGTGERLERFREAMQEFVDRCDRGQVRSRYTYNKFKGLLGLPEFKDRD